jgi:hypothetical protein
MRSRVPAANAVPSAGAVCNISTLQIPKTCNVSTLQAPKTCNARIYKGRASKLECAMCCGAHIHCYSVLACHRVDDVLMTCATVTFRLLDQCRRGLVGGLELQLTHLLSIIVRAPAGKAGASGGSKGKRRVTEGGATGSGPASGPVTSTIFIGLHILPFSLLF